MSTEEEAHGAPAAEDGQGAEPPEDPHPEEEGAGEEKKTDQPQPAWAARRDLASHTPRTMGFGDGSRIGGGVFGGTNHGIGGGTFYGDVLQRTEIVYRFDAPSALPASGEIAPSVLTALSACFAPGRDDFDALADRLRDEHVLVLSGPYHSGRRTAALMLMHRIGADPVRAVDRDTTPEQLTAGIKGAEPGGGRTGYVLCDLVTPPGRPLREADLLAAREELGADTYLVITTGPAALLEDVPVVEWGAPAPGDVLAAHLAALPGGEERVPELLALPATAAFLERHHQPREAARFARLLASYAAGTAEATLLDGFSLHALERQVQEWFEDDGTVLHLREKAFLVALAAFDEGPYALTAELADLLYAALERTDSRLQPAVPVFGTHIGKRLQLARARRFEAEEPTEWGPVQQVKAAFLDERTPLVLLRELWTGHPSARPALVHWLRQLAGDGRPFVRTRAASTVAVLAHTDLPSAMALIVEPWASSRLYRHRSVAVGALTLTHVLGTPHVPRILDAWCESEESSLRWVAIRAHGMIGPERPVEALAALRAAARHEAGRPEPDPELMGQLAESVELLLLSPAGEEVTAELVRTVHDDRPAADLALGGFLGACRRADQDERHGLPSVLARYARASTAHTPEASGIAGLWRTALGSRGHTRDALGVLRQWVLVADRAPAAEWALAALLPALVTTEPEHRRISHLLRTMPGEDGAGPPPVAARLLTVLPRP